MLFVAMATVGAVILIGCSEIVEPSEEPPTAVLTGVPTGTSGTTVLAVTVSGVRVTRYRHKVTEGTACTNEGYGPETPVGNIITDDISALEDGPVTLCVLGETESGVRQTEPTKASWTKKTPEPPEEPPTAVLTGAPAGTNDITALSVTVSGDRVARYRHKVTEGTACANGGYGPSTPVGTVITDDISALDDGPVTLCVLGETAGGIRQTEATKASWTKETPEPPEEPPTAVLTGAPAGTNDITALSVTVSGDRVARYRHKVTEGTACANGGYGPSTPVGTVITDDISALDDGPVTLCVLGETAGGIRQTEATKASWTKETPEPPEEPPTAVLTGAPTGTNDITALSVTVSGDRVARYRHKVAEGTACTNGGYGPSTPVGTIITDDISALDDGPVTLCVLGETAGGIRQTDPTKASWTKETPEPPEEPPTAVLTGAPTGTNDITALSVTVSGDRVARYRHKVTEGTACTNGGYGPSTPVGNIIRDDISALEDGPVTLCVLGETAGGIRQTDPTKASWTKETVKRGRFSVPGVNQIPLDMIRATNNDIRKMFVVTEQSHLAHGQLVRRAACTSYTIQCEDPESRFGKTRNAGGVITHHTGTAPYTSLSALARDVASIRGDWIRSEIFAMGTAKIVTFSIGITGGIAVDDGASIPFLQVQGAGNTLEDGTRSQSPGWIAGTKIPEAIAADKLLIIAGWERNPVSGRYTDHPASFVCKYLDDGCLWARMDFHETGAGTSLSSPNVGAGLASVLSVFPDTTHQNLARFAKACARKTGDGIEELLRNSGGVGVADFSCMGPITDAARNLPAGGSTTVIVDGKTVTVTERELVVR